MLGISTLEIIRANTFIGEVVDVDGSTLRSSEVTPARPSSQCIPELPKNKIAALTERIQEVLIAMASAGACFALALAQSHLLLIAAAAGQEQSREEPWSVQGERLRTGAAEKCYSKADEKHPE